MAFLILETTVKEKLKKLLLDIKAIADGAMNEDRNLNDEEKARIDVMMTEAKSLKAKIDGKANDEQLRKEIAALGEGAEETQEAANTPRLITPFKNLGRRFVSDPRWKAWMEQMAPDGNFSENVKGFRSPAFHVKDLITGGSDTSAGATVVNDRYPGIIPLGRRPLVMRDLVTNLTTQSDAVDFVRITAETNNAAVVAEATSVSGGNVKPESGMTFEKDTANVKTIAHWIPVTKQAISDSAQLSGIIEEFLEDGLEQVLETEMVTGSGSGNHFEGLSNTSGVQSQAWDTDLLTTTRKARRKVRTVGRDKPTAYLMHPEDWERIDLLKDAENRYYFGGPVVEGTPRLWGLPVIESEAVEVGVGYVGNFRKAILWDRQQATITATDSHSDFFIRNLVAILAELRAAFAVIQPTSFVEIDLTA